MYIFIPDFWLGVLALLGAEIIAAIVLGVRYSIKQRGKDKSDEQ